ncbi:hypothetical protein EON64_09625 [archaeon]|nr:MAG: hypothetical protein EON64_09625 [archaeon]
MEEKLKKKRLVMERQLAREARERDAERAKKIEEARLKTESLLKQQEGERRTWPYWIFSAQ